MLTFLVWDPCSIKKIPLTACTLPVEAGFGGARGSYQSNWLMLEIVGRFLQLDADSAETIRGLVFDQHGSHSFVRRVLHGDLGDLSLESLQGTSFFKHISYKELPANDLPRLPLKLALYGQEPIFAMVGPCALDVGEYVCHPFSMHFHA